MAGEDAVALVRRIRLDGRLRSQDRHGLTRISRRRITYREYERSIETESGPIKVQWPVTEVVIDSMHVLGRKDRSGKGEVA
jgi:hypothetical protein